MILELVIAVLLIISIIVVLWFIYFPRLSLQARLDLIESMLSDSYLGTVVLEKSIEDWYLSHSTEINKLLACIVPPSDYVEVETDPMIYVRQNYKKLYSHYQLMVQNHGGMDEAVSQQINVVGNKLKRLQISLNDLK